MRNCFRFPFLQQNQSYKLISHHNTSQRWILIYQNLVIRCQLFRLRLRVHKIEILHFLYTFIDWLLWESYLFFTTIFVPSTQSEPEDLAWMKSMNWQCSPSKAKLWRLLLQESLLVTFTPWSSLGIAKLSQTLNNIYTSECRFYTETSVRTSKINQEQINK